jgi:PAS domain S-box-containing protein
MAKYTDEQIKTRSAHRQGRGNGDLLAAVVRASNDAITVQAFDGRILAWNVGAERMYGYTEAEALEMNISAIRAEPDGEADLAMVGKLAGGDAVESHESRRRTKDGCTIDVWLTATVLRDDEGAPSAFSTTERDITERKHIERALREGEERFRVSLINSPVMVFSQDRELRYTWLYHPRPPFAGADVIGKTDAQLAPAAEASRLTALKLRVLETGVGAREDIDVTQDGDTRYYDLTVEPLRDSTGAVTGVTGACLDITERRRTERKLQEAREELESRVERQMAGGSGYGLTFRELTVLHLVADGMADKEIAAHLGISPLTAQKHLSNILSKMGAGSRTEAGVRAVREHLLA